MDIHAHHILLFIYFFRHLDPSRLPAQHAKKEFFGLPFVFDVTSPIFSNFAIALSLLFGRFVLFDIVPPVLLLFLFFCKSVSYQFLLYFSNVFGETSLT